MSDAASCRDLVRQGPRRREFPGRLVADPPRPARPCARVLRLRPQRRRHRRFRRPAGGRQDRPARRHGGRAAGRRDVGSPSALRLRASLAETGVTPRHSTDLLIAFRRDATKLRYADWDELFDYCRYLGDAGRAPRARPARRGPRHLCAVRCAVHVVAGAEPSAGLRAGIWPTLDRCYLPLDLLERCGRVGGRAARCGRRRRGCGACSTRCWISGRAEPRPPPICRAAREAVRLRLETAVIVGLAHRLARRLRRGDPLARRVKLTRRDVGASALAALRYLAVTALAVNQSDLDAVETDRPRRRHLVLSRHARAAAGPPPRDVCDLRVLPHRRRHRRRATAPLPTSCRGWRHGANGWRACMPARPMGRSPASWSPRSAASRCAGRISLP